ncbi:hypothetical protein EFA46_005955 [Halarchaeum sp. CBA1220]|uniref:DUF5791 family protein n=1 Tax=Halarchaeum sp. CBA1220 TaxID=1853682 RepID=UPI000F3A89A3|nr:DUF5791 family protein [Halarchaeum sp. CBA1220]QLC33758.1 hypothetical protein EFA46_005955 [Halarchaeum sp. CBA1220]
MLTEEIADPEATSPTELRTRYLAALTAVTEERGVDAVAGETDLPAERVEAIVAGDADDVTLEEATALLACSPDYPSAEDYLLEVRDHLMLQMSSAVVDVDSLRRGIETELDAKELQQKVEGRRAMSLSEYARVTQYLASENPW